MSDKESEGEDLIADFLDEKDIDFKRYYKIPNLENDNKFFREADFYIPKYDVYLEFLGMWDNPVHKERYKQKMRIYRQNNIACIYIWPDNLGTLDWIFNRRLKATLLKYKRHRTLLFYELESYFKKNWLYLALLVASIYFFNDKIGKIVFFVVLVAFLFITIRKEIMTLIKIKKSDWVSGEKYKIDKNS